MKAIMSCVMLINFWAVAVAQSDLSQVVEKAALNYQAGIHFEVINPAWEEAVKEPIVYEFFSYMCPGCNGFEPVMDQLAEQAKGHYKIIKVPVALYPQWEPHAKTYYALQMMGELDRVHKAFFAAIHQYKKQFRSLDDIAAWLTASFAIDSKTFLGNAQSFVVDSKMRKGNQMIKAMGVNRLPTLVVDGKYKPKFDQLKTQDNIVEITQYLVQKN